MFLRIPSSMGENIFSVFALPGAENISAFQNKKTHSALKRVYNGLVQHSRLLNMLSQKARDAGPG